MNISVIWPQNAYDENQFDYVLSNFKSDKVYVLGDFQCTHNVLRDAPRISSSEEIEENFPIVLLAPSSMRNYKPTIQLQDFEHPPDAIYVFGPNNLNLEGFEPDYIVEIPTDTDDEMFNYVSYAVTMWHRRYG